MSKGPCLCGDTECPWCGSAQGTYTDRGPDFDVPTGYCTVCGASLLEEEDCYVCDKCSAEIRALVKDTGE